VPDEVTTPSPGLRRVAVPAGADDRPCERVTVFGRRLNGTIVCVVDDPAGAPAALDVARRLADQFDARMLLVSVADGVAAVDAVGRDDSDEEHLVGAGDPAEAVARIAADEAADLIVLGAQRGRRARTLRSLLAADLAATAPCPVVVAPPRSREVGRRVHRAAGAG
jgi:nucleotide-binding universal stress UspA family protein